MQSKGLWLGHSCAPHILHTAKRSVTLYGSSSELFMASKSWECFLKALGETSILLWGRKKVQVNQQGTDIALPMPDKPRPARQNLPRRHVLTPSKHENHEAKIWFSGGQIWETPETLLQRRWSHSTLTWGGHFTCGSLGFSLASLFPSLRLFAGTWWIAHWGSLRTEGSAELHGKTETQTLLASWYQARHCSDSDTLTRLRLGTST